MLQKSKKKELTITSNILIILIVILLCFIWSNSLESTTTSQAKSLSIMKWLTPVLEPIIGVGNVTDHLVRKLAHFIEFGVLGAMMALYAIVRNALQLQSVINCMSFGLTVAVIDESLQLVSNRGSQVQDVLIDFAGVISGTALVFFICFILWKLSSLCKNR